MLEQQQFLSALTERDYRYWHDEGVAVSLKAGQTLVEADDFPDLYLVLKGQWATERLEVSPGIVGLDEFLTGWMTNREWVADTPMTLLRVDAGRFGQMLTLDTLRRHQFHQATLPVLSSRLFRQMSPDAPWPLTAITGLERGVMRFESLLLRHGS